MEINKPKEKMYSEVIEHYYKQYGVGRGLISQAIQRYGDSKYTHRFLEFVKNVQENCATYNKTFDEIIKDYNISQAVDY